MEQFSKQALAFNFFTKNPLGTLATTNEAGSPESAAVYYKVDEDLTGHFVTKTKTRKYENIVTGSAVSFSATNEAGLVFGEIMGTASVIASMPEALAVLPLMQDITDDLRHKYWVPPIAQIEAGSYALVRVKPTHIVIADYSAYTDGKGSEPRIIEFDVE